MKKFILLGLLAISALGGAIDLKGTYIAPGGSIYGVTSQSPPTLHGGGTTQSVFNAAAKAWNDLILDDWTLDIQYGWSNTIGGALAQYTGWWFPFGDGRHIQGRVILNPNFNWFADGTPEDNVEYGTYTEYEGDLGVGPINTGKVYTGAQGAASGRYDLYSVIMHELGHSLGIGVSPRWASETSDGDIDVTAPRRCAGCGIPVDVAKGHLHNPSTLMWYGTPTGQRKLISDVDLEAAMEMSQFAEYAVVPEPGALFVLTLGISALLCKRKR